VDHLSYWVQDFLDFVVETLDWITDLGPARFCRVFWAMLFLEVPRYVLTDFYILVVWLLKGGRTPQPALPTDPPLVSVVMPALNEEETIEYTVKSIREQEYPNLEIVVIDDGSTDRTPQICKTLADRGWIRFLRMERRQGKSAALNFGVRACRGEYVIFMDTDSTLDRGAIIRLLEPFQDPRVGAVAGNLEVRNRGECLLTRFQALEYMTAMSVGRRFKAHAGILSIVPGAFGAFRRALLERVGGHEPGPGNDSDLTIRVRKLANRVAFAGDAICLTSAPTTWRSWIKQRLRWDRNIIRNRVRKHRDIFDVFQSNFSFGTLVSFLDILFFAIVLTFMWVAYIIDTLIQFPHQFPVIFLANFVMHLVLKLAQWTVGMTFSTRPRDHFRLLAVIPVFGLYRLSCKLVRIVATVQELLFRISYKDPFAPEKVQREMEIY